MDGLNEAEFLYGNGEPPWLYVKVLPMRFFSRPRLIGIAVGVLIFGLLVLLEVV
jgi:hypothetical protein